MKFSYEELITCVDSLRSELGTSEWGLPLEIKELLLAMAPTCDKCGQATDERLEEFGMSPVLCRCEQRKRFAECMEALAKLPPPKNNYLTEIEINAFALADTMKSTIIINRRY